MPRTFLAVLALASVAFASSAWPALKRKPSMPPLTKNLISGESLWRRFAKEDPYKKFGWWPGHEGTHPGQSPHGEFHRIYVHPLLIDALPIADGAAPGGSIVVKCSLDADENVKNFTVMAKVSGYDPAHDDWFRAMFDAAGTILAQGKIDGCISRHEILGSNDYLIVHPLNK
jgi:hypothetical protein